MKLILSRKGFDSIYGGVPCPILPDGRLCYLPIPDYNRTSPPHFYDISRPGVDVGQMVADLTRGKLVGRDTLHLDPDLGKGDYPRARGWRPCFGQCSVAQAHLDRMGVGPGDLFLFFGWFRAAEQHAGKWRYVKNALDLHVLFGWLEIEKMLVGTNLINTAPDWAQYHAHVRYSKLYYENNTLFVGPKSLQLFPRLKLPGGGLFPALHSSLQLTDGSQGRSVWRLPKCFAPRPDAPPLSYHADPRRWKRAGKDCQLHTVGRGQEFVLDLDYYPGVTEWLKQVFQCTTRKIR
jgi:hypothetical protein